MKHDYDILFPANCFCCFQLYCEVERLHIAQNTLHRKQLDLLLGYTWNAFNDTDKQNKSMYVDEQDAHKMTSVNQEDASSIYDDRLKRQMCSWPEPQLITAGSWASVVVDVFAWVLLILLFSICLLGAMMALSGEQSLAGCCRLALRVLLSTGCY